MERYTQTLAGYRTGPLLFLLTFGIAVHTFTWRLHWAWFYLPNFFIDTPCFELFSRGSASLLFVYLHRFYLHMIFTCIIDPSKFTWAIPKNHINKQEYVLPLLHAHVDM